MPTTANNITSANSNTYCVANNCLPRELIYNLMSDMSYNNQEMESLNTYFPDGNSNLSTRSVTNTPQNSLQTQISTSNSKQFEPYVLHQNFLQSNGILTQLLPQNTTSDTQTTFSEQYIKQQAELQNFNNSWPLMSATNTPATNNTVLTFSQNYIYSNVGNYKNSLFLPTTQPVPLFSNIQSINNNVFLSQQNLPTNNFNNTQNCFNSPVHMFNYGNQFYNGSNLHGNSDFTQALSSDFTQALNKNETTQQTLTSNQSGLFTQQFEQNHGQNVSLHYTQKLMQLNETLMTMNNEKQILIDYLENKVKELKQENIRLVSLNNSFNSNSFETQNNVIPFFQANSNNSYNFAAKNSQTNFTKGKAPITNTQTQSAFGIKRKNTFSDKQSSKKVCFDNQNLNTDYSNSENNTQTNNNDSIIVIESSSNSENESENNESETEIMFVKNKKVKKRDIKFFPHEHVPKSIYESIEEIKNKMATSFKHQHLPINNYSLLFLPIDFIPDHTNLFEKIESIKIEKCEILPCFAGFKSFEHSEGDYSKTTSYSFASFSKAKKSVIVFTPLWFNKNRKFLMLDKNMIHVCFYNPKNTKTIDFQKYKNYFVYNIDVDSDLNIALMPCNNADNSRDSYISEIVMCKTAKDYYALFKSKVINRAIGALRKIYNQKYNLHYSNNT